MRERLCELLSLTLHADASLAASHHQLSSVSHLPAPLKSLFHRFVQKLLTQSPFSFLQI